ncbi:Mu transposase domain-containing protein [Bradyrhizobium neotropicale]|uniref:Mu transposase domain-containing protein n=1 Tax=Bradyrhizobium neotropicale TaxID=1497615 RepID=UPI001FEF0A58|nr:hypothetical protein [Bradyrhizobium neotropicale]
MNGYVIRRLGVSRKDLFDSVDRPALRPLPETDYEFAEWRLARVAPDYHIEVEGFCYSVPHALIRAQVDVRITARTIEVFHRVSPLTRAATAAAATAPIRSTCRARTGVTRSGRRPASSAGRARLAQIPKA